MRADNNRAGVDVDQPSGTIFGRLCAQAERANLRTLIDSRPSRQFHALAQAGVYRCLCMSGVVEGLACGWACLP